MIIVKKDSEVMTNYVAANPVPAREHFAVFNDIQQQPAVFALGENGVLNLVITTNREPTRFDFAQQSGLFPEDVQVQAFAVLQAPDSSLDICIATKASDKESNFYLLHHITLDEITGTMPSAKVTHGLFPTVDHIYMGHKSTDNEEALPLVMVAFQRPDRLTTTEDLNYVRFAHGTATLVTPWGLPVNPKKIVDVTLITCSMGDGVMVLYEGFDSGKMYLVFKVLDSDDDSDDSGDGFAVQVACPDGATCLASYLDPSTGKTVALVGGAVITALTSKNYTSSHGGSGTVIDATKSLKDLQISQTGENLRFWYTNTKDAVYYYTTTTTLLSTGVVIPLLANNQGGRISSLLSSRPREGNSDLLVSSLISVDENGNLSLLQQDPRSQAWQSYPYWHASTEDVMEVKGLMLRLHTTVVNEEDGDSSDMLPGSWLRVTCSGLVRCIINGKHTTVSLEPRWYQTDAKGVLNILLQTDDATIHQFAVDAYRPAEAAAASRQGMQRERNLADPLLDPTDKILPKLDGVQTEEDVRKLTKPDGSLLFPDISDENAKGAAAAFSQLTKSAKDIREQDKKRLKAYHARIASPEGRAAAAAGEIVPLNFWDDVGDWVNGAWEWLEDVAEDVWDWVCDFWTDLNIFVSDGVWTFIIKIGEEIYQIALTTITSIVKGIVWVFKKIGGFIQDLIEFLGFLFEWGDILDTTDSIAAGFNAALDYGEEKLATADIDAKAWLEDVRKQILSNLDSLQNNSYQGAGAGGNRKNVSAPRPKTGHSDKDNSSLTDDISATVPYNWSTYYFTYGGGPTNAVLEDDSARAATKGTTEDDIVKLWDDLQDELETIKDTVVNVAGDLVEFFNPQNYSVQQVINKVTKDLVDGMMKALEKLVDLLFDALKLGVDVIRDIANKKIEIPVITWLWKNVIARGRPLTLLNFCALLVAIPTTVLYKAKKNHAPPKLKGRLTKETFGQYVSGQADSSLAYDILGFNVAAVSGAVLVGGEFDMLSLLVDGTFEGLGLEFIPIGPIDALMNVMDSATLTFNTMAGVTTWPVAAPDSKMAEGKSAAREAIKYAGWGLSGAEALAGVILNRVAKKKDIPRPVKKRFKATLMAVMSVPSLALTLTGDIMDEEAGAKPEWLLVSAYVEAAASFGASWGGAVARWNDEFENLLMYAGIAVNLACTMFKYYLLTVDFVFTDILG
ncbi:uncharacterized protein BO97DRAFT_459557 [Aspergillus homomorphus CBS 101889]|uniref:Uncharacterized protein n=1 Tax=Aspergillus homomorphus (strain CBS 101889) TaxID=1450537 RepID=A0A395HME4_ASPHC|nr:hypothetical protein BO97DRAFT_459557 [Aspergillus homomorphus CBS 101889]RAL09112.1 hypothetical protein BO97DRAFT_459557 [Aspergillus homomorphus CBS 101889]